jgi:hypothetical protein
MAKVDEFLEKLENGEVTIDDEHAFSFFAALTLQQLKEFATFMKKYKKMDDLFDSIFEEGDVPTEKQEKEFADLKEEYDCFMKYFKEYNYNFWGSKDEMWTPITVAERIVEEAMK